MPGPPCISAEPDQDGREAGGEGEGSGRGGERGGGKKGEEVFKEVHEDYMYNGHCTCHFSQYLKQIASYSHLPFSYPFTNNTMN